MKRKARPTPWTAEEDRVVDAVARRIVAGEFTGIRPAVPECRRRLRELGFPVRHPTAGIAFRLNARARALGWDSGRIRWTAEESRVAERYARALARGKYPDMATAALACQRALERAGLPGRRTLKKVIERLTRRSMRLGRSKFLRPWTPAETRIVERFALRLARGSYPTVRAAAAACQPELDRVSPAGPRPRHTLEGKISSRARDLGRAPGCRRWTECELRVVDREARKFVSGRTRLVDEAAEAVMEALGRRKRDWTRTLYACRRQVLLRAHAMGRQRRHRVLTEAEERIVQRVAGSVLAGAYPSYGAAVEDCRGAFKAARTGPERSWGSVAASLRNRLLGLGRSRLRWPWLPEEKALADRFARAVARGRYRSVARAAGDFHSALEQLRQKRPDRFQGIPPRSRKATLTCLEHRVAGLNVVRPHARWTEAEERLVDRYARAAVGHRYTSAYKAGLDCFRVLNRRHRQRGSYGRSRVVRPLASVLQKVYLRCVELNPRQLARRDWALPELKVARRWARRYDLYKQGKRRMNLKTIAGFMQAELDRLGYFRSVQACVWKVSQLYKHG